MVFTNGAEDFTDTNANGVSESGETWTDLPEPYIDENENGFYDVGEYFVDVDGDSLRGGADGVWNGPCLWGINPDARCPDPDSWVI